MESPMQSFDGEDLYTTVQPKAARICYSLISNYPFIDGNKRIRILVMLTVLVLNGITVDTSDDEIISLGLAVAQGKISLDEMTE